MGILVTLTCRIPLLISRNANWKFLGRRIHSGGATPDQTLLDPLKRHVFSTGTLDYLFACEYRMPVTGHFYIAQWVVSRPSDASVGKFVERRVSY